MSDYWYARIPAEDVDQAKRESAERAVTLASADLGLTKLLERAGIAMPIPLQWFRRVEGDDLHFMALNCEHNVLGRDKPYFADPALLCGRLLYDSDGAALMRIEICADATPREIFDTTLHELRHLYQRALELSDRHYICKPEDDAARYALDWRGKILSAAGLIRKVTVERAYP